MDVNYYNGRLALCIIHRDSLRAYPTHSHIFTHTAALLLKGSISLTIGNVATLCAAGDTFFIPTYTGHSIKPVEPYSMICLSIYRNPLNDMQGIKNSLFSAGVEAEHIVILMKILDGIDFYSKYVPPAVAYGIERICESGLPPVNTSSRYHFIREFKRVVGIPPHRLHVQRRVRMAQQLLEQGLLGSAEIASACGFFDQSHLIRHFKKYTCLTPDEYRLACVSPMQA